MELFLVNLIRDPKFKDLTLEEIMKISPEEVFRIPESVVPLVMGRAFDCDIVVEGPLKKGYGEKLKEFFYDAYRQIGGRKRIRIEPSIEKEIWAAVSNYHCIIDNSDEYPSVRDNNSRNGTYVNQFDANVTGGILLNHNDRLCLGPQVFKVFFPKEYRNIKNRSDFPPDNDLPNNLKRDVDKRDLPTTQEYLGEQKWV